MSYIFRIEKRAGAPQQLLGYDWIEVLAVEPWALGRRSADYGDWCDRTISVTYVCLTEVGLVRIGSEDFWAAVEDYREYASETGESGDAAMLIQTGDSSVVQVASTVIGDVHAGGRLNFFDGIPRDKLVAEIAELREALRERSVKDGPDVDTDVVIGALAEAERAAKEGDEAGFVRRA
jgi:hypothetical protein